MSENFPAIAPDGTGGGYIYWEDYRDYAIHLVDLYAQHLTSTGVPAPGWPADGLAVCTDPAYQSYAASQGRDPAAQAQHDAREWDQPLMGYLLWLGTTRTAWRRMRAMEGLDCDAAAWDRWLAGRFPAKAAPARRLAA